MIPHLRMIFHRICEMLTTLMQKKPDVCDIRLFSARFQPCSSAAAAAPTAEALDMGLHTQ